MRLTTVPPLLLQRHEARPKNSWLGLSTHRQVDHQAVRCSVVHRDRPLHLATQVGDVHPLALQQLHSSAAGWEEHADAINSDAISKLKAKLLNRIY